MNRVIRDRGYIRVNLGVISKEAQSSATLSDNNTLTSWSNKSTIFDSETIDVADYATMEQNRFICDGSLLFLSEDNIVYNNVGIATDALLGSIEINFDNSYSIKGLTIDFTDYYPTEFSVEIEDGTKKFFSNDSRKFITDEMIGTTNKIIIKANRMVGGQGRLRIKSILFGVGLTYSNNDVEESSYDEYISAISEEVSQSNFSVTILDPTNKYDVDTKDSFINFLEIGQNVSVMMGMTLEDKTIEWVELCNLFLDSWGSSRGKFSFTAMDRMQFLDDEYTLGNRIYTRTAYEEAEAILQDMGLEADEYKIDTYLNDVILTAPMPPATHKECLQVLSNACRCTCFQSYDGKIMVMPNFAIVIEPDDIDVRVNKQARWSNARNVLVGATEQYGDVTQNFLSAKGFHRFLPEVDGGYIEGTGFVSDEVANYNGEFSSVPVITFALEAGYSFYGIELNFDGNPPQEIEISTYLDGHIVDTASFTDLENKNYLYHDFNRFDTMSIAVVKAAPNNRVLISKWSLGDYSDFVITNDDMKVEPLNGARDSITKQLKIKIFKYEEKIDSEGNVTYAQVDDDVWYTLNLNPIGECLEIENPLITTQEMAETLAEWLGQYYKNNVSYSVEYRGDPRLNAGDIIHVESAKRNSLQVVVESNNVSFNGAFSGSVVMRKALKTNEA